MSLLVMTGAQPMIWCLTGLAARTRPWTPKSPHGVTTMPGAANTAGFALDHAHKGKLDGAEEANRRQGLAFLVAETYGGRHSSAQREVKKSGSVFTRHTGQDEVEAVSHLWGRLGILLQRGNAAILGNQVPALPEPQIDGIM